MNRRLNLCTMVLVGLCMLPVPGALAQTIPGPEQYESNDTQSSATILGKLTNNVPVVIHANLHGAQDQGDWYLARAPSTLGPQTRRLVVLLAGPSPDTEPGSQPHEVVSISRPNNAERSARKRRFRNSVDHLQSIESTPATGFLEL